ncbi:MAG TPA: response regulator [Syntrophobacteria bacterium]|nr:response regulator [Syntrophobacteria bacterium]
MANKILVVDDELAVRSLLKDFFTPLGYEVITAADGTEGLASAAKEVPDVILLDVMMPGIDGMEVCRRLKANEGTGAIPIIMMTGVIGVALAATLTAPDDLVLKPLMLPELLARVQSIIAVGHLTNRLERLLAYIEELDKNRQT